MRSMNLAFRSFAYRLGMVGCLSLLWFLWGCGEANNGQVGGTAAEGISESGAGGASGATVATASGLGGNESQLLAGKGAVAGSGNTATGGAERAGAGGDTARGGMGGAGTAGTSAGTGGVHDGGIGAGAGGKTADGAGGANGSLSKITLWIAGDSTVMTYDPAKDPVLEGWGQEVGPFFSDLVTVNNQAIGGRSTRTFMYQVTCAADGVTPITDKSVTPTQWGRIKTGIKAGDFLLIQFGHNDAGTVCERHVELDEYKTNLSDMADIILANNATPIFVTPMSKLVYKNGTFQPSLTDYADAMKSVAKSKSLECVDLNTSSLELYKRLGYDKVSTEIFQQGGNTHFQKQGAIEIAKLVTQGLKEIGSPLAKYIR